jgi:hypothetical protein
MNPLTIGTKRETATNSAADPIRPFLVNFRKQRLMTCFDTSASYAGPMKGDHE